MLSLVSNPAVEFRRKQRANAVAQLGLKAAFPIILFTTWLDLRWGNSVILCSDALLALGFVVALYLTSYQKRDTFFWEPAYFALWVNSLVVIYFSGGASSPYLTGYLGLLLVAGAIGQIRFGIPHVLGFFFLNFFGWSLYSALSEGVPVISGDIPFYVFGKKFALLAGFGVFVFSFVAAERKFGEFARHQSEKLKETENHLIHATRMAEVGDLIAMTVHDLAQPIQVFNNAVPILKSLLQKHGAPFEPFGSILEKMESSGKRAMALIVRLRDFSRNDPFDPKELDLNDAIESLVQLVRSDLESKKVDFEFDRHRDALPVFADENEIQQIILNLMSNARDAANSASRPVLRVSSEPIGNWVRMKFENNGNVISLELQGEIFKPYFTTKEKGRGTGLGLMICEKLVAKYSGRIFFASGEDRTIFVVDLPRK